MQEGSSVSRPSDPITMEKHYFYHTDIRTTTTPELQYCALCTSRDRSEKNKVTQPLCVQEMEPSNDESCQGSVIGYFLTLSSSPFNERVDCIGFSTMELLLSQQRDKSSSTIKPFTSLDRVYIRTTETTCTQKGKIYCQVIRHVWAQKAMESANTARSSRCRAYNWYDNDFARFFFLYLGWINNPSQCIIQLSPFHSVRRTIILRFPSQNFL